LPNNRLEGFAVFFMIKYCSLQAHLFVQIPIQISCKTAITACFLFSALGHPSPL